MRAVDAVNVRYEAKFARLLEGIAARSVCLIGSGHQGRAIRSHVIPASKLRLIAAPRGRWQQAVVTFDLGLITLQGRAAGKLPPVRKKLQHSYASIGGDPLTRPFACADHDNSLFEPIDGPDFHFRNPTHRALVSCRTLLWLQYEALSFARALGRIRLTPEFRALPPSAQRYERVRLERRQVEAGSLGRRASELHREAVEGGDGRFVHRTIWLPGTPKVAFAGACTRGGGALWTVREREAAPLMTGGVREAVPFVLTCYPDPEGHMLSRPAPASLSTCYRWSFQRSVKPLTTAKPCSLRRPSTSWIRS